MVKLRREKNHTSRALTTCSGAIVRFSSRLQTSFDSEDTRLINSAETRINYQLKTTLELYQLQSEKKKHISQVVLSLFARTACPKLCLVKFIARIIGNYFRIHISKYASS